MLLLLDQTQRLDALPHCNWKKNQEHHLPSWTADWSLPISRGLVTNHTMVSAGISSARASFAPPGVLEVDGVHCATVSAVYEPIDKNPVQASDIIRQWAPSHFQNNLYPTGESYMDAFATTIIRGRLRERFPRVLKYPALQEWKKEVFSDTLNQQGSSHGEAKRSEFLQYLRKLAFIVTEEGYIGLSVPDAKPGMNNLDILLLHRGLTQYSR
jgi:hypothetical protein